MTSVLNSSDFRADPREPMEAFLEDFDAQALADEDDEGMQFRVLRHEALTDTRPVVLWIHPGDACEHDADQRTVREAASELEHHMGQEILNRAKTHRLVVLHRQSTLYAFDPGTYRVADTYWQAMDAALEANDGVLLWGDDLDKASQWILKEFDQAPVFFLTGAWTDPKWGCVSHVGQALLDAGKAVEVSVYSPSEPGTTENAWRPVQDAAQTTPTPRRRGP